MDRTFFGTPHEGWIPGWRPRSVDPVEHELQGPARAAYREVRELATAGTLGTAVKPARFRSRARSRAWRAWKMGFEVAAEQGLTPWDALLGLVRHAAFKVAQCDESLATATSVEELVGNGRLAAVERLQFRERQELARVAKMAIDAGIAARLVAQVEADGQAIAGLLVGTLNELGLPETEVDRARGILRRKLLELDSGTIEGSGTWSTEGTTDDQIHDS